MEEWVGWRLGVLMDGWVDWWAGGLMREWVDGGVGGLIDEQVGWWESGLMEEWVGWWLGVLMDELIDGWWIDKWVGVDWQMCGLLDWGVGGWWKNGLMGGWVGWWYASLELMLDFGGEGVACVGERSVRDSGSISFFHGMAYVWYEYVLILPGLVMPYGALITVRCCYNAVSFLQFPHNKHPISRPLGRGMGCMLWVSGLIHALLLSLQCCV